MEATKSYEEKNHRHGSMFKINHVTKKKNTVLPWRRKQNTYVTELMWDPLLYTDQQALAKIQTLLQRNGSVHAPVVTKAERERETCGGGISNTEWLSEDIVVHENTVWLVTGERSAWELGRHLLACVGERWMAWMGDCRMRRVCKVTRQLTWQFSDGLTVPAGTEEEEKGRGTWNAGK